MAQFLRLAILKKGQSEDLSQGTTILHSGLFDTSKMTTPLFGYYVPWVDAPLGQSSAANDFIQPTGVAPAGALLAMRFTYRDTSSLAEEWTASALSSDVTTGMTSSPTVGFVNIPAQNSYTVAP